MKTFLAVFFGILAAVAVITVVVWVAGAVKEAQHTAALESEMPALSLRTISASCDAYRSTFGRYPDQLSDLGYKDGKIGGEILNDPRHAGLIDPILSSGKKEGYIFIYRAQCCWASSYTATASPEHGGGKHFFVDETGVVRVTTEKRAATATDLPDLEMETK